MSLADALTSREDVKPKVEDDGFEDVDVDQKPQLDETKGQEEEEDAEEDKSQADEDMDDLFGDDKDVEEVRHGG